MSTPLQISVSWILVELQVPCYFCCWESRTEKLSGWNQKFPESPSTAFPDRQLWFRIIFRKHLNFLGDNFCEISHEAIPSVSTRPQDGVVTRQLHCFYSNWVFEQTLHTIAVRQGQIKGKGGDRFQTVTTGKYIFFSFALLAV